MIYLDNAATTQMSQLATQALMDVSRECYGNASSIYSCGRNAKRILEESRRIIAECIGAEPDEIYFTSGGTESNNWIISQAYASEFEKIITSKIEHHAILHPIKILENVGKRVEYLPVDNNCIISCDALQRELSGECTFVSLMLQNNETGAIQQIKEFSNLVHKDNKNSFIHTDAVQAVGHYIIDVKELGVDALSASAHKFNGPKGVGFLYVKKGCKLVPYISGGGQERGFRSGTENVAGIYAMAKALEENVMHLNDFYSHIVMLEKLLFKELDKYKINYSLNIDSDQRVKGIINISFAGMDGEGLLNVLDAKNICVSTGSACNSKDKNRSHVLEAMGLDEEAIDSTIRISIGRYNSEEDIKELVKTIARYEKLSLLVNE